MKTELRALLMADAEIRPLAPGGVNWGFHPQGVGSPYITLTTIAGRRDHSIYAPTGPRFHLVQVDCYGPSSLAADTLARRVEAVLDGYRVPPFQGIFLTAIRDLTGIGGDENEVVHRVSLDFDVVKTA